MVKRRRTSTRRSRASAPDESKADESEIKEESVPNEEAEEDNKRHSEEDQGQVTRRVRTRRSAESSDVNEVAKAETAEPESIPQDDDIKGEDTEDVEQPNDDEEEEEEDEDDDESVLNTPSRSGRRGRPPGSKNKATLIREMAGNLVPRSGRGRRSGTLSRRSTEEPSDQEGRVIDSDKLEDYGDGADSSANTPAKRGGRRSGRWATRGRGRSGPSHMTSVPLDVQGKPQEVVEDEIVLPEDPAGEEKVSKLGELTGERQYRVRTFTVTGRGARLYMLSTEPARCMGFRDSYLLFQKHKKLYKIIVNEEEKYDLIERDIIPHSYKGRAIGIVTARSVFREFGARIIVGGKKVIDDYYEEEAKALGFVPGQIADPEDKLPPPGVPYNKNQYVAWHGASAVYHQYTVAPPAREVYKETYIKRKKIVVTDENWMLEHANAASTYNHETFERRKRAWQANGIYEPHSGVRFFPATSQPHKASMVQVSSSTKSCHESEPTEKRNNPRIVIETVLEMPNSVKITGLSKVPAHIFETASPEIREAILKQQELELEWS